MEKYYWKDAFKQLLNPDNTWSKYFIGKLLGKDFVDWDIDFDGIDVIGSSEEGDDSNLWSYNIIFIVFNEEKKVFVTFTNRYNTVKSGYFIVEGVTSKIAPYIVACNVLDFSNLRYQPGEAHVSYAGKVSAIPYKLTPLTLLCNHVGCMVDSDFSDDFYKAFKFLLTSMPPMIDPDYEELYFLCSVISSGKSYKEQGVCEEEILRIQNPLDVEFLDLIRSAYNHGKEDGILQTQQTSVASLKRDVRIRILKEFRDFAYSIESSFNSFENDILELLE